MLLSLSLSSLFLWPFYKIVIFEKVCISHFWSSVSDVKGTSSSCILLWTLLTQVPYCLSWQTFLLAEFYLSVLFRPFNSVILYLSCFPFKCPSSLNIFLRVMIILANLLSLRIAWYYYNNILIKTTIELIRGRSKAGKKVLIISLILFLPHYTISQHTLM